MECHTAEEYARKGWMSLLACAPQGRIEELLSAVANRPEFSWLRAPKIGSVMVRGRTGGTGAPFNLGEMTVTRCSLRLATGEVGHGYVQGRRKTDAEAAALVDALMQTGVSARLQEQVLTPLANEAMARRIARSRKAAATKVEFFTMERGHD